VADAAAAGRYNPPGMSRCIERPTSCAQHANGHPPTQITYIRGSLENPPHIYLEALNSSKRISGLAQISSAITVKWGW
jgi:hypothetical protein